MHSDEWERVLSPVFENTPYELFGVEFITGGKKPCLRIYIDKADGISIGDIGQMSREISIFLDAQTDFDEAYTLEVSSPGLDRTLFKPSHYQAQIGKELSVKLKEAVEEQKRFRGQLVSVGENTFELQCEDALRQFAFFNVDKAKVIPTYQFNENQKRQNDE